MIVLFHRDTPSEQVQSVLDLIERRGLKPLNMPGDDNIAVGIASFIDPGIRQSLSDTFLSMPGVYHIVHVSRSYKLASRDFKRVNTEFDVNGAYFGGQNCVIIAGPCAVESEEQILASAAYVASAGAKMLRGGAFKPRTSPYSFQGLQEEGLRMLQMAGRSVGIATITEVVDPNDVDLVASYVDMLQIGARNMQNFALLIAAGKSGHPVLLKRGPSATIDDYLNAAEYLLHHGSEKVVLCERGVHPLDKTYTRNTLDINAIPVLKEISHLPVIADPSHGIGHAKHVPSISRAAIAAGADGLIVEVHPDPREALSDGQQSLTPFQFEDLMVSLRRVAAAVDRGIA